MEVVGVPFPDLLEGDEASELLVAGDRITPLAAFEARRYAHGEATASGGLSTADGHALVLGERDIAENVIQVKELATGEQEPVSLTDIVTTIQEKLK